MLRRPSFRARLLLALILAVGFGTAWCVVTACVCEAINHDAYAPSIRLRADGTPVKVSWHPDQESIRVRYTDMEDRPVEMNGADFLPLTALVGNSPAWHETDARSWAHRISAYSDVRIQPTYWYLINDGEVHGTAYFVGFDVASKRQIGFLGTHGFRADDVPPRERFQVSNPTGYMYANLASRQLTPPDMMPNHGMIEGNEPFSSWTVYLLSRDGKLYEIDLRQRTARVAWEESGALSIGLLSRLHGAPASLAIYNGREVVLLDKPNHVERRYKLPPELAGKSMDWTEVKPGEAIASQERLTAMIGEKSTLSIYWFDAEGHISRREELTRTADNSPNLVMATCLPVPAAEAAMVGWFVPRQMAARGAAESLNQGARAALAECWPALLAVSLLSLILAGWCYRREVRFAGSALERAVWPAFVFFFGLPGWIGYRYARRWPALARCPSCGKRTPRDREACACCRSDFPRPTPRGTEIRDYEDTSVVSLVSN